MANKSEYNQYENNKIESTDISNDNDQKIHEVLTRKRKFIIRKLTLTATIKVKIISEIEADIKKKDIQEITKKATTKRKQVIKVATVPLAIIDKIEKLPETLIIQKPKNL